MFRRMFGNRKGTAEIVGTVLFLVILFFFFSNVFLWNNQKAKEMENVISDKANSPLRIETTIVTGTPVGNSSEHVYPPAYRMDDYLYERSNIAGDNFSLTVDYTFPTGIDTAVEKSLTVDVRFNIRAIFYDSLNERCFVYIRDFTQGAWVNTGLLVMNAYGWSNVTLSSPLSYIDGTGTVRIRVADASAQMGNNDSAPGILNITDMAVYVDQVGMEVTNLGGSDATLSRLWIVNTTQTMDAQNDHMYADLADANDNAFVKGGSTRTILLSTQTMLAPGGQSILATEEGDDIVVNYAPPAGYTVIFRVLTTLGNSAACSYDFH